MKPQIEIWFGLSLVRSVKIYAPRGNCRLGGNYYRPPSCCYSLPAGGFLHKSPDSMRAVSQHVCVCVCLIACYGTHIARRHTRQTHTDTKPLLHTSNCTAAARKWIDKDLTERKIYWQRSRYTIHIHTHTLLHHFTTTCRSNKWKGNRWTC